MDKIKTVIIIVIILIILTIVGIIFVNIKSKQDEQKNGAPEDTGMIIEYNKEKPKQVSNNIKFYTVTNCIYQYLDFINENNSSYSEYDENDKYKEMGRIICNVLSDEYKQKNNITEDNVYKYVEYIDKKKTFIPLKMNVLVGENIEKYIVYGLERNPEEAKSKEIYIIVNLDVTTKTFSIEPINDSYNNIQDIEIVNNDEKILENSDNKYQDLKINNEYIVKQYFTVYQRLIGSDPEIIYDYLDEEYKEKRFGDIEQFKEYIEKNKQELSKTQIKKYLVNNYNKYTEYVCMDGYQNSYIFNEKNPMDFTLKLDTYTIITDKFKQTYDSSNKQKKVMMNVDKWIQMLNNRDYTAAYNVLDKTFRNNNFDSEEQFEKFMREKYPLHYKVEYNEFNSENNTYIQNITLSDITQNSEDTLQISIIMQLKDNYEFVMSFNIE